MTNTRKTFGIPDSVLKEWDDILRSCGDIQISVSDIIKADGTTADLYKAALTGVLKRVSNVRHEIGTFMKAR